MIRIFMAKPKPMTVEDKIQRASILLKEHKKLIDRVELLLGQARSIRKEVDSLLEECKNVA